MVESGQARRSELAALFDPTASPSWPKTRHRIRPSVCTSNSWQTTPWLMKAAPTVSVCGACDVVLVASIDVRRVMSRTDFTWGDTAAITSAP